jgi:pimeloyl-ACP methyl ester carboxylesterase
MVELFGQRFMALGTRMALHGNRAGFSKQDLMELSALNDKPGSARAFARTVRDVIDWRGQRRTFFQRAHELAELPPIAVFWGDRDAIIPASQGRTFAAAVDGVVLRQFEGCGHYLHNEQPIVFVRTVREFLDDPTISRARLRETGVLATESEASRSYGPGELSARRLPEWAISP